MERLNLRNELQAVIMLHQWEVFFENKGEITVTLKDPKSNQTLFARGDSEEAVLSQLLSDASGSNYMRQLLRESIKNSPHKPHPIEDEP